MRGFCQPARILAMCALLLMAALGHAGAAPNLFGEEGLILSPTADAMPKGAYAFGINTVDETYRRYNTENNGTVTHYYHHALLPFLDITLALTNFDNQLLGRHFGPARPLDSSSGGWNIDKMASARALLLQQGKAWCSLAVGWRDFTGTSYFTAKYAVLSRSLPLHPGAGVGLTLHAGYGTGTLKGAFGGVEYRPAEPLALLLESERGRIHLGARYRLTRQFDLQPAFLGLRGLGGGVAYHNTW